MFFWWTISESVVWKLHGLYDLGITSQLLVKALAGFAHWELPLNGLFSHYILITDTKFRNSKCNLIVKAFSLMWHDLWFCGEEDFSELVFVKLSSGNVRTFSSSLRYIYLTQVGLVWNGFPFLTNTVVRHNNRFSVYIENSLSVLILLRLSGSVP